MKSELTAPEDVLEEIDARKDEGGTCRIVQRESKNYYFVKKFGAWTLTGIDDDACQEVAPDLSDEEKEEARKEIDEWMSKLKPKKNKGSGDEDELAYCFCGDPCTIIEEKSVGHYYAGCTSPAETCAIHREGAWLSKEEAIRAWNEKMSLPIYVIPGGDGSFVAMDNANVGEDLQVKRVSDGAVAQCKVYDQGVQEGDSVKGAAY